MTDQHERQLFEAWYRDNYAGKLRDYPAHTKCERAWMARAALTAPPPASTNRLTDEQQIKDIAVRIGIACIDRNGRYAALPVSTNDLVEFARAIIAASDKEGA